MNKYLKKILVAAVVIVVLSAPAYADSNKAGNIRACFMNMLVVLENYPAYEEAYISLKKWMESKKTGLEEKGNEIQRLQSELKKNVLLSEEAKKEKTEQINEMLSSFQMMQQQLQKEFSEREAGLMEPIKEELGEIIKGVVEEKGFNIVYDASSQTGRPILYLDDDLDVTEAVVEKVKKITKKPDVKGSDKPKE